MQRLRLGIDLDGVVYDFQSAFRAWVAYRLNRAVHSLPVATRWTFYNDWGLSGSDFETLLDEGIRHGRVFAVGDPIPGAVDTLQRLAEHHDLVVITHRNRFGLTQIARHATEHWLRTHNIPAHELHLDGDKTGFGVDLHLDDSPQVLTHLHNQGVRAVAFHQPWNDLPELAHLERVHGWDRFEQLVNDTTSPAPVG